MPAWVRIAVAAAAVVILALVLTLMIRLFGGALKAVHTGGDAERDPQFAESVDPVTRPPELTGEEAGGEWADDPSAGWDLGEQTPVDMTAEELSRLEEEASHQ